MKQPNQRGEKSLYDKSVFQYDNKQTYKDILNKFLRIMMRSLEYRTPEYIEKRNEILKIFGANMSSFNAKHSISDRILYLKDFIKNTGLKGFVLGISGGVDSTTTGRLCQLAVEDLRNDGIDAKFVAMRLPAGIQFDEAEAQEAMKFINPDIALTVNIGEIATLMNKECVNALQNVGTVLSPHKEDFNKGNGKARIRMSVQYYVASVYSMAVVSTDHNSEAVTGFFTKFGDGAADLTVLDGLTKTQVRLVAKELGAPTFLCEKPPTADLEELYPGKIDDINMGFPYDMLESFLMGNEIDREIEEKIIRQYIITQHKRDSIVSFKSWQSNYVSQCDAD